MQPSDLLLAAADRIRDLAAATTPGQWGIGEGGKYVWVASDHLPVVGAALASGSTAEPDCAWIAALSPAVAPHLEAILRAFVPMVQGIESQGPEHMARALDMTGWRSALALAKSICPDLVEEDQK